jgi:sortase B
MNLNPSGRYGSISEFIADFTKKDVPVKRNTKKKNDVGRKILTALAVICFVVSLGFLLNYYVIDPYFSSKRNDDIASMIESTTQPTVDPWIAIREKYPDTRFPQNMNPAFADLYAANNDFAGWVSIPGLDINTAVVQAEDNDKYLRRDLYGKYTSYGVPFFDYHCQMRNLSRNTVIYGHNMRHDDKIFGTLEQYKTIDGFRKAPLIGMSTLYGDYTFKVYAAFITNSDRDDDNGNFLNYIFTNTPDENFSNYIAEIDKRKFYSTGVDINSSDKILTLSTCCYDFSDARLVVVGRLLREGESPAVDTSLAVMNPNPKLPQAFYKANGKENPHKNDTNLFND